MSSLLGDNCQNLALNNRSHTMHVVVSRLSSSASWIRVRNAALGFPHRQQIRQQRDFKRELNFEDEQVL
jgi:hypothetical protein